MPHPLLRIENLAVSFGSPQKKIRAVMGVNLAVYPQQTLAVVGESGCGKSVSALSILQLVPTPPGIFESGRILWSPQGEEPVDLLSYTDAQMQHVRGNQIAMIFQEPMTSLNPVYTIGEQILEAVLLHQRVTRREATCIAAEALDDVGIADAAQRLKEYPHQMSGGMRQRIMIAMALACQPALLLADEPTTALDVTIQAQILDLLHDLKQRRKMAVMLISHDLGVVAENADVVAVMYAGRVVEYGAVEDVFRNPQHPYTRGLFQSMPRLGEHRNRLETIPGGVPNPAAFPPGCPFHPRCAAMKNDPKCSAQQPPLLEVEPRHWAACWHADGHDRGATTIPDVAYRREEQIPA